MRPLIPGDPGLPAGYTLVRPIGQGGMGTVHLAWSPAHGYVALKIIKRSADADLTYRLRFHREVTAARRVPAGFTARVLDHSAEDARPWLATEYLPGLTLWEAVDAHGGGLPAASVRALTAGLAEALTAVHGAGIVHRDLKPGNVMLTRGGPRVLDFGIARPEDATVFTAAGELPGTVRYMSPEQRDGREAGRPSDVYSLGAVLAFAATGRVAERVDGHDWAGIGLGGLGDPALAALIGRCLSEDPGARPTAAEVLEEAGDGTVSLHGTGWLPEGIGHEIDLRAADVDAPVEPAPGKTGPAASREMLDAPTLEPPRTPVPEETTGGGGTLSRRGLLGAGAALGLAAGLGAVVWQLTRPGGATGASGEPSASSSASAGPPPPPPAARLLWKKKAGGGGPDVFLAGGVLVSHVDNDWVRGLDARTGEERWKRDVSAGAHVGTAGGHLYLASGDGVFDWNTPWRMRRLDPKTGDTLWSYGSRTFPYSGPARAGDLVVFGYDSVSAVRPGDGGGGWTADVDASRGIAVAGDVVAALGTTKLVGLDAKTGREKWTLKLKEGRGPLGGGDMIFLNDGEGYMCAVNAKDGELAWRSGMATSMGTPAYGEGLLYVSSTSGRTTAVRSDDAEEVWSTQLGDPDAKRYGWGSPLGLSGGVLYAGGTDRVVYALGAADGTLLWTYDADVVTTSPPLARDGIVYIGTSEGHVHALEAPEGGAGASSRTR